MTIPVKNNNNNNKEKKNKTQENQKYLQEKKSQTPQKHLRVFFLSWSQGQHASGMMW